MDFWSDLPGLFLWKVCFSFERKSGPAHAKIKYSSTEKIIPSTYKTHELSHEVTEKSSIDEILIYETQLAKFYGKIFPIIGFFLVIDLI